MALEVMVTGWLAAPANDVALISWIDYKNPVVVARPVQFGKARDH